MDVKKVGEFIKRKRKEKKLTQKELAQKLLITDRAISKWERGICCPDISLLRDLSSILGVSVNELLSGEDIVDLEKAKTDDVLIESVKQYTLVEKEKNKKLLIVTCILLGFYIFVIIWMYLMFNQINYTDGITLETLQNKRIADNLYTALEKYDYDYLRKISTKGIGYNRAIYEGDIEDENKCDYYLNLVNEGKIGPADWGIVCRLKDFSNNGIKFISHKYSRHYYAGMGDFAVDYTIEIKYKEYLLPFNVESHIHNDVITYLSLSPIFNENDNLSNIALNEFRIKYPLIYDKIINFFRYDDESEYPKNS